MPTNTKQHQPSPPLGPARRRAARGVLLAWLCGLVPAVSVAAELTLVVQPVLPPAQVVEAYQPLADYLTRATGQTIRVVAAENFVSYWETMKRGAEYDLILDAAHFTDFRAKRMKYTVLAKLPDTVSYSLVTGPDTLLFDPLELVGKRVATLSSPSLGAVRLEEMFPNPSRQPVMVSTDDADSAIALVQQNKAAAAIVPTPLLNRYPNLNVVLTTQPVPHMALSAAPGVSRSVQQAIRQALLDAANTPQGQSMLQRLNLGGFEPTTAAAYDGYARLLEGVWGY